MQARKLYRYLFAAHSLTDEQKSGVPFFYFKYATVPLSDVEKQEMASFFTQNKENPRLREIVECLNLTVSKNAKKDVLGLKSLSTGFQTYDEEYHYFDPYLSHDKQRKLQDLFLLAYCVLYFYGNNNPRDLGVPDLEITKQAYKMVILFGDETNPEHMFELFDVHCQRIPNFTFQKAFDFALPIRSASARFIDLNAWRKLLQEPCIQDNLQLFALASEIEVVLNGAPSTRQQALGAAKKRTFRNAKKAPLLAAHYIENLLPEIEFNALWTTTTIPPQSNRLALFLQLPTNPITFESILVLADELLAVEFQSKWLASHKILLMEYTKTVTPQQLFKLVKSRSMQSLLIGILEPSYFDLHIKTPQNLINTITEIHPELRYTNLSLIIGPNRISSLFSNEGESYRPYFVRLFPQKLEHSVRDLFLTEKEKAARKKIFDKKKEIETTDFAVGRGGVEIVLDEHKKTTKKVPATVAAHWKTIDNAMKGTIAFEIAWANIQNTGAEASKNSNSLWHPLVYLTRSENTISYYAGLTKQGDDKQAPTNPKP